MGPKKGKKEKVGGTAKERLTKSQYLAIITEKNTVLANEKIKAAQVEKVFLNTEKKYQKLQEDMADVVMFLESELKGKDKEIEEFEVHIKRIATELKAQDKHYGDIILRLDEEQKGTKHKLTEQMDIMSGKIKALEEVRLQREEYVKKQEALDQVGQALEKRLKEEMYITEKKTIVEQDTMRKDMEDKLTRLTVDFREATDVRIGVTTNRILKENIRLGNLLTCKQEMMSKVRKSYEEMKENEKKTKYNLELKESECQVVMERYFLNVSQINAMLQSYEELTQRIATLSKMVRTNKMLKKKTNETECRGKQLALEIEDLIKAIREMESSTEIAREHLDLLRKNVIKLETTLFEAAKKVKQTIELEKEEEKKNEEEGRLLSVKKKQELIERNRELICKMRELIIENVLEILSNGHLTEEEKQLMSCSTESYEMVHGHGSRHDSGMSIKKQKTTKVSSGTLSKIKEGSEKTK